MVARYYNSMQSGASQYREILGRSRGFSFVFAIKSKKILSESFQQQIAPALFEFHPCLGSTYSKLFFLFIVSAHNQQGFSFSY